MKYSAKQRKQLFDQIFELKFLNKQLNSHAKKCQVEERTQQRKAKAALDDGNTTIARTYATNAIRKKNEATNYIQLASRLDAVISRLNQQTVLAQVDSSASSITKSINKLLKNSNADKMATNMMEFQSSLEELDKATNTMENALSDESKRLEDASKVDELMKRLEEETALDFREQERGLAVGRSQPARAEEHATAPPEPVDFMAELNTLRQ